MTITDVTEPDVDVLKAIFAADPWKSVYSARAEVLADGRKRVHLTRYSKFPCMCGTTTYTTVRNIDGSNRFMEDGAYWNFMPDTPDIRPVIEAALKAIA